MPGRDDDERSEFERAMGDARPLPHRDKLRPPPPPTPRATSPGAPQAPVAFAIEIRGEHVQGIAPGIDRRHLRRLRRGAVPVDARVDLHGLATAAARAELHDALLAARETGARCVLVVHGRGRHSPAEPVLKAALPAWLAAAPLGAWVMAFASATPEDGGPGASYVLLRRSQ